MKRINYLMFLLCAICFLLVSCETNEPEQKDLLLEFYPSSGYDVNYTVKHPRGEYVIITSKIISVHGNGYIAEVGDKKLNQINHIPTNGWAKNLELDTASSHGYVVRWKDVDWDEAYYLKMYIVNGKWVYYSEWNPK